MNVMSTIKLILAVIALLVAICAALYSSKVDKRFWEIVEQIKQMEREEKEWENQDKEREWKSQEKEQ